MRTLTALLLTLLAGCGPFSHNDTDAAWLVPETRRASRELPDLDPAKTFRVAVYGDVHCGRLEHRAVVAAIRREKPDLVVYMGDALDCRPLGHLPDCGEAAYAIPLWPQFYRGRPAFSFLSFVPFPAVVHELLLNGPWPIRHANGLNDFLEDSAPLRLEDGVPFLFVPGNHDVFHEFDRGEIARLFGEPGGEGGRDPEALWFATDAGGVRFVVLNTGTDTPCDGEPLAEDGAQLRWLDAQLAGAEARGMTAVVCAHLPPRSSGTNDPPREAVTVRLTQRVMAHPCVRLVLSGHMHEYERVELARRKGPPATFVVTGGAGGVFDREPEDRVGGSQILIEDRHHFVLLEFRAADVHGKFVAVDEPPDRTAGASRDIPLMRSPPPSDEFTIPLVSPR
ncbi:MAG: metallophosphoesterase [Planctomycetes bacterium]|nr:metallophosphoesterase [Planctomycetota bacterium]